MEILPVISTLYNKGLSLGITMNLHNRTLVLSQLVDYLNKPALLPCPICTMSAPLPPILIRTFSCIFNIFCLLLLSHMDYVKCNFLSAFFYSKQQKETLFIDC